MLDSLTNSVLHHRRLVVIAAAAVLIGGWLAWSHIPIDAFPDVTNVQVMILTKSQGMTPEEVERRITVPIETEMGGLPNVRQVRSLSQTGLSQVVVIFEDSVDTWFARQLVFERLSAARENLPDGAEPELGPVSTGLGEIYQYALEVGYSCADHKEVWSRREGKCPTCSGALVPGQADLMDLRSIQDWTVGPALRRLQGLNEINSLGGFVKQYHILIDPARLLYHEISLKDLTEAITANNANAAAGYIRRDQEQYNVLSEGLLRSSGDIEQIVLKSAHGALVYLKDVATVGIGSPQRYGAAGKDGRGETVLGMTIMLKDENSKRVVDAVKKEIPEIQKSLPVGVRIVPFYDRTGLIQACIRTVSTALAQGGVLVILVLLLLMGDLRAAIVVSLSLPVTAAGTFLLMGRQGLTANLMSLGGLVIAIGMVVDASIVVTENIARHMAEPSKRGLSRMETAAQAVREVIRPVIFAILIIVIVFVPMFALESLEGKMFKPLAVTICMAMFSSLIVSLTVVPALACILTRRTGQQALEHGFIHAVSRIQLALLRRAMSARWITIAATVLLMALGVVLFRRLGSEFLPALDEGAIAVNLVRLPTAGLDGSVAQSRQIEKHLLATFPDEIETIVSKTGRAEISEDPMGPEQTDLVIPLTPRRQWKAAKSKEALVRMMQQELAKFPGIRPAFSQPIALRVNELVSGIKSDIAIKIFGEDIDRLIEIAGQISPILATIEGAQDIAIEQVSGFSQYTVRMNRSAMASHGISVATVNDLVETAVGGKVVTDLYEGRRRTAVVVRFDDSYRSHPDALLKIPVLSPAGYPVPMGDLVTIGEKPTYAKINREDSQRRLLVECNVRGRDLGGFVQEARRSLEALERDLPEGYRIVWSGQFENQQRAQRRLAVVVPITIGLIFLMLVIALKSFSSAGLILLNLPFAVFGGIAAMYLMRVNFSVAASVGFIAILGIAVENALVLVSFCEERRRNGATTREAIVEACRLRIRPLLMTTFTTLLGLLPMLYATGSGSEIQKPLVAVIFGGLVSTLILDLIVLPVVYEMVHPDIRATA